MGKLWEWADASESEVSLASGRTAVSGTPGSWSPPPLRPMSAAEAAGWYASQGGTAREVRGHWWVRKPAHLGGAPGYWFPADQLAPLAPADVVAPSRAELGYRAVVADAAAANSMQLWEIVDDLPGYGLHRLQNDRMRRVRRALERFEFRTLEDPEPIFRQGYEVAAASAARTGQLGPRDARDFRRQIEARYRAGSGLVVGAFEGERLAAFALSRGVGQTAHFTGLFTTDDAMRAKASDGMYWCVLLGWSRAPGVHRASLGMHLVERPGLWPYKRTFGAQTVELLAISRLRAPVEKYLRRYRPEAHARLLQAARAARAPEAPS